MSLTFYVWQVYLSFFELASLTGEAVTTSTNERVKTISGENCPTKSMQIQRNWTLFIFAGCTHINEFWDHLKMERKGLKKKEAASCFKDLGGNVLVLTKYFCTDVVQGHLNFSHYRNTAYVIVIKCEVITT